MTGIEMMIASFVKLIPKEVWGGVETSFRKIADKVNEIDTRLARIEFMQSEILRLLQPDEVSNAPAKNGAIEHRSYDEESNG